MGEPYTPTTSVVRATYKNAFYRREEYHAAEFDRWLAQHDAEVKAEAWDEGHRAGCPYFPDCQPNGHHDANPYTKKETT